LTFVEVSLLYIADCANRSLAQARLVEALARVGRPDQLIDLVLVASADAADQPQFRGSPTILVDGVDPWAPSGPTPRGLACRMYFSAGQPSGAPSVEEIVQALTRGT
jgi:hypothetical protein